MKTIRLEDGSTEQVETIIDYIDSDGREYAVAYKGNRSWIVVDRDSYGPIWGQEIVQEEIQ